MKWKIYYQTSTYTSDDGEWSDAPPRGVQALAIPHPTANRQIQTGDFYLWPPWTNLPIAADLFGMVDYLIETGVLQPDQPPSSLPPDRLFQHGIKLGRSLDDQTYNQLYQRIVEDADLTDWGPKTTKAPNEK